MIFTGDLGAVGSKAFYELLKNEGVFLKNRHRDCGMMIFDRTSQDVHAGGSGCGCCASVLCSEGDRRAAERDLGRAEENYPVNRSPC